MAVITQKDLQIAKNVTKKIHAYLGESLMKIILFGSRTKGEIHPESDFDFLVIGDFKESSWPNRAIAIRKEVGYFGYAVDYLPVTPEEFEKKVLIRKEIQEEGVVLFER
jgi:predicted nucleotidyltransferase